MRDIQFNLLPDSKVRSVEEQKSRSLVTGISFLVAGISVAIFLIVLASVYLIQNKQLSDVNGDITAATNKLKGVSNLDSVLTVQNQLHTLVGLHQNKHISSRIFTYLPQVTPPNVFIGRLSLDFSTNIMQIDGTADTQHSVNTFIDTLKFTQYTLGSDSTAKDAFSPVVETSFGIGQGNVIYSLSAHFDPALFSNNLFDDKGNPLTPTLKVPSQTTTRSVLNDPSNAIFNGQNSGEKKQ